MSSEERGPSRIAEILEGTKRIVSDLDRRTREQETLLASIRADLRQVMETSQNLARLIWTGNGMEPLVTRVAILEATTRRLETQFEEEQKQRAKFRLSFLMALIGLAGSLISVGVSLLKT